MPDPDPPRPPGFGLASGHDVAAAVDPVVAPAGAVDPPGGLLERPALDEAGRIEPPIGAVVPGIEGAAGDDREVVARRQHVADIEAGVLLTELAAGHAADLAVGSIGAEAGVDIVELGEDLVDDVLGHERRPDVQADGRAHDVMDAPLRHDLRHGGHHNPAWSSAAWSDCAYASLV